MLKSIALGRKLILGFASVALITAGVGFVGNWGLRRAIGAQKEINSFYLPAVNGLWMIKDAQDVIRRVELVTFLPQLTANEIAGQKKSLATAWGKAEKGWSIYAPLPKQGQEAALWKQFQDAWADYKAEHDRAMGLLGGSEADRKEAYDIVSYDSRDKFRAAQILMDKLLEMNIAATDNAVRNADRRMRVAGVAALAMAVAGVVASLVLGVWLSSVISRNMDIVVATLSQNSDRIYETARSLSSSADVLATGAAQEAASLEETSASMEEVSSMARRNMENSEQTEELATRAARGVEAATASMQAILVSMKEISATSEQTGKIIRTIDEIAFQTNLIALNAAVEAARAGEAGAGFAVVAEEVRSLARRVAKEAAQTSSLIEGEIRKIGDGTALVEKSHAEFADMASSVERVMHLVREISGASREQARGIGEVGRAMSQLEQVTQRTAAKADEISVSAEQLNAWSDSLEQAVRRILELVRGADGAVAVHGATEGGGHGLPPRATMLTGGAAKPLPHGADRSSG